MRFVTTCFYWFVHHLTRVVLSCLFPWRIIGLENIPRRGPFILASNHLSNLDPVLIGSIIPRRLNFLAKESLFQNTLLALILHNLGSIPLKREGTDFHALREAIRKLKAGGPLVIFPEGSRESVRRAANRGQKVYAGIGFLAAQSGAAVIPVKISGSDQALPVKAKWPRRRLVTLVIGKPHIFSGKELYPQIAYQIMDSIASL